MTPTTWILIVGLQAARLFRRGPRGQLLVVRIFDEAEQPIPEAVSRYLDVAANDREFERLELVAAPDLLMRLRSALSSEVWDRISRVLDRDLAGVPDGELSDKL